MRETSIAMSENLVWIDEMSLQIGDITIQLMSGLVCKP